MPGSNKTSKRGRRSRRSRATRSRLNRRNRGTRSRLEMNGGERSCPNTDRIEQLEKKFHSLDSRVEVLEFRVKSHKDLVKLFDHRLNSLQEEKYLGIKNSESMNT